MKLITNFRDYYDSVARQDRDPSPIWVRNGIKDTDSEHPNYGMNWNMCSLEQILVAPPGRHFFVIGFAGKLYPCYRGEYLWESGDYSENILSQTINYDPDKLSKKYNSWNKKWVIDPEAAAYLESIKSSVVVDRMFRWFGGQFLLEGGNKWQGSRWTVPVLSEWGFVKILPPAEAWQEICMWRNNQAEIGRPIPEMSNDVKIQLAGFDTKRSFRKPKGK